MKRKNFNLQIILSLALGSEICYIVIAAIENLRNHIPLYLFCYGFAFILYWIAAVSFFNFKSNNRSGKNSAPSDQSRSILRISWLNKFLERQKIAEWLSAKEILTIGLFFGIIFRLTLLLSSPSLSDDIYRYIWDGKVASHGINPFQYPPNAEVLRSLQDKEIYPNINHKEISTIYPPVNQFIFQGLYKLHPSVLTFKAAFIGFDLLTIGILYLLLKSLALSLTRLLIYVWNPLVIVEFAGNGHADIVGILLLTVFLWLLMQNRLLWSSFILALSFLTKYIAILFLPLIAMLKKEYKLIIGLLFVIVAATFYLPYADAGERLFSGLIVYSVKWQFNASIFTVILSTVKALLPENWIIKFMITPYGYSADPLTIATRGTDLALMISKGMIVVIYAVCLVFYLFRLRKDLAREGTLWIFKLGLILLGTFFLINPTVQPWYLCWLLPLLVIVPNRAWILLTGLVTLSYWILIDYAKLGIWQESNWLKAVEYLPFYALLAFDGFRNKMKLQNDKLL
ncbi:MAG: hypothetical protein ACE5HX_06585 [bacterium]